MKICRNCGKELRDNAKFCTSCGVQVNQESQEPVYEEKKEYYEEQQNVEQTNTPQQSYNNQQYTTPQQYGQQVPPQKKKSMAPMIALIIFLFLILFALIGTAVVLILGNPFAKEEVVVGYEEESEEEIQEPTTEAITTEVETETEEETTVVDEAAYEDELNKVKRMNTYGDFLSMFYGTMSLPDVESMDIDYETLYDNDYAIADVDQDGQDELLIRVTETYMAGMMVKIYDMDMDKYGQDNVAICELTEFPSITVYDNGVITADWSHNQGMGDTVWPFSLYTYDASTDTYERKASIDSWNKELSETDNEGNEFPEDLDKDGDGVIYYVTDDDFGYDMTMMDGSDYEDWYNSYLDGASEMELNWKEYKNEDITQYARDYIDTYIKYHDETQAQEDGTDIGRKFLEHEDFDEVLSMMKDAGVQMEENGDEEQVDGYDGDDQVFMVSYMDNFSFEYMGKKVEDVTVLGIYPGMNLKEAEEKLSSYGFYNVYEQMYITGDGFGNIGIYLINENDKVTGISMRGYCGYAG